jgi:hypothetical protein
MSGAPSVKSGLVVLHVQSAYKALNPYQISLFLSAVIPPFTCNFATPWPLEVWVL